MIGITDLIWVIWVLVGIPVFLAVFSNLAGKNPQGFHYVDMIAIAATVGIAWPFVTWLLYSNPGGVMTGKNIEIDDDDD